MTTKELSPDEAAKVLEETISILNAVTSTTGLLHDALMQFRERIVPEAETDKSFDNALEILRLMAEGIPQRLASAILGADSDTPQSAPTTNTLH